MREQQASRRIVVTGLGVVSAIGHDVTTFFRNAKAGTVAISPVRGIDISRMNAVQGAEIAAFDVAEHFPGRADIAAMGRAKQMALVAARQCLADAAFPLAQHPYEVGVSFGYTQGESKILEECTERIAAGTLDNEAVAAFAAYAPQSVPHSLAREFGLNGPLLTIGNACSASVCSIGAAIDMIRGGAAQAVLTGGADAFSRYGYAGFARLGAIASDAPRPFSAGRRGMVPGEGAAMLFIESLASARGRGATVYAEIAGYGESCDAFHITQPDPNGIAAAMRAALAAAAMQPSEVSFVSVHGTGTNASDKAEAAALSKVFGHAIPPLSSIKSMTGHPMGAASAIECVAALCSMREQVITPTMGYLGPDPECPVDCVPNAARPAAIRSVLKTASAFGGNNVAVVFRQLDLQES
ncbi:3-oxoacyl-[acyl-carrier-protein] synthase II [Oxalobacteraceae bacterium GrIS 1.11]